MQKKEVNRRIEFKNALDAIKKKTRGSIRTLKKIAQAFAIHATNKMEFQ